MEVLACFVEQPEGAELPAELRAELLQDASKRVLDGFRLGEGTADGVLHEQPTVEVVALMN